MSKISGKETKPELIVRKYLFSRGYRYRKNENKLPGKPDILLPKFKTLIFIHGCFWHGHNCKFGTLPETNKIFWENKINNTKDRDKRNINELRKMGWRVIVIWQCELKNQKVKTERLEKLINEIKSN